MVDAQTQFALANFIHVLLKFGFYLGIFQLLRK